MKRREPLHGLRTVDVDDIERGDPAPVDVAALARFEGLARGDILKVDGVAYIVDDDGVFELVA